MSLGPRADERTVRRKHSRDEPRHIACLACGEARVVFDVETGECPRCHYVGWVLVSEIDGYTRRAIMNGAFAGHHRHAALRP